MAKAPSDSPAPVLRKGMPSPRLDEAAFRARFRQRFDDPAFAPLGAEIDRLAAVAWQACAESHKSPVTRKAGPSHADPDYDMLVDWIATRAIRAVKAVAAGAHRQRLAAERAQAVGAAAESSGQLARAR